MHWTTAIANPEFHDHQCKCNYVFMYDYYNISKAKYLQYLNKFSFMYLSENHTPVQNT